MKLDPKKRYFIKDIVSVLGKSRPTLYSWEDRGKVTFHQDEMTASKRRRGHIFLYGDELEKIYKKMYGREYDAEPTVSEQTKL